MALKKCIGINNILCKPLYIRIVGSSCMLATETSQYILFVPVVNSE